MSGYVAGVEGLNVLIGKLAVGVPSRRTARFVTDNGYLAKNNIDLRLYDLKGPAGLWAGWFKFATSKGGGTSTGIKISTTDGYAFGLRHQRVEWHGGYHALTIQYGIGAASNFSASIDDPTPFLHSSASFLATERVLFSAQRRVCHYAKLHLPTE